MARLELRQGRFRNGEKRHSVNLKATDQKEANACLARLEETVCDAETTSSRSTK